MSTPNDPLVNMFSNSENIKSILRGFFFDGNLDENLDLFDIGILDSLSIMELVMFIEEKLPVEIYVEDITREHFESINAITGFVWTQMCANQRD